MNQVSESTELQNKKHQKTISSTVSLVKAIFEEVSPAINIHKRIATQDLEEKVIDPAITMFNYYDKNAPSGYFFEQGPIYGETNTALDKELLKLLEGGVCFFTVKLTRTFYVLWSVSAKWFTKQRGPFIKTSMRTFLKRLKHIL
jgi:hypothetical protein